MTGGGEWEIPFFEDVGGRGEKQVRSSSTRLPEAGSFLELEDAEMVSPRHQGCRRGLQQGLGVPSQPGPGVPRMPLMLLLSCVPPGWLEGVRLADGEKGWVPQAYVEEISSLSARLRNLRENKRITSATSKWGEPPA